jgi:hypothetical protein
MRLKEHEKRALRRVRRQEPLWREMIAIGDASRRCPWCWRHLSARHHTVEFWVHTRVSDYRVWIAQVHCELDLAKFLYITSEELGGSEYEQQSLFR